MLQSRIRGLHVMIVEDDAELREALVDTVELGGAEVTGCASGHDALRRLREARVDIVISDVNMAGMDGHELLRQVREQFPHVPVILMTAFGSIARSVQAMRDGASDYLVKPFQPALLIDAIARHATGGVQGEEDPVAVDPESLALLQLARQVARSDATVLLCGESGTGKEVVARYVHRHSPRCDRPYLAINCAAIPENMLEALLFGHEKGAFTGAYASQPGKFEQAHGGTLLLDEISEMNVGLQAKLLRVIQEREVERLGGRKLVPVDVRLIATTNRDLREEVAAGRFREDLYYRLSVFPLQCRPLRERMADILPLAEYLARKHTAKMHRGPVQFDRGAAAALLEHRWPGNVRELENAIQRALILQPGSVVSAAHLRLEGARTAAAVNPVAHGVPVAPVIGVPAAPADEGAGSALNSDLRQREFRIIVDTLRESRGSKSMAAERLGISPRTLRYKLARMRESGLDVERAVHA